MNFIERVKNMMLSPKTEWEIVRNEKHSISSLVRNYVGPFILLSALTTFIGYGLIGKNIPFAGRISGISWGISMAIQQMISLFVAFVGATLVTDTLAKNFQSEKNMNESAKFIAFASTPAYVAGILSFLPAISSLLLLAGFIYSIYLMFLGVSIIKQTPEDKKITYLLAIIILWIIIAAVISFVLSGILDFIFGNPATEAIQNATKDLLQNLK